MATVKKRVSFFDSEQGIKFKQILEDMADDTAYNTVATYSADAVQYPDNLIPFVDKHMNYINTHPSIDPDHYLANLRLITRFR
jgi:hypothetical protein